jgi:Domain of unknown function (DUF4347)/Hint domain
MADQGNWRDASAPPFRQGAPDDTTWALGSADAATPDTFPKAGMPPSAVAPSQIVFIEGSVADYQILADGVLPGVTVVILNPDANGVQQIANYLQEHDVKGLDAISIVADGANGELQLGNTLLSASNIADYQQQLATIGAALAPGGDLLLYGCDVAQNSAGDAFLGDLAAATGVGNIAAASHVVGSAADGGSFNLDVDLGNAAAATGPFTAATVAAYPDVLSIVSNLVWYVTVSSTTSQTGVYTINVDGGAAATNATDILSTPSYSGFSTIDGLAIDPSAGVYFVANYLPTGPDGDTNQIIEGNVSGGTASVIYTSGNSGGDAIVGLAFDQLNGLLYFAVTDVNIPSSNTTTGIYTISALGSGTRTASELVNLNSGTQAPNDIAIDTTHNLLFYTDGVPGLTGVEEVGVASLTTGAIINGDLVSYSASGNVEPYGIAVNPATDTIYWTTVNFAANAGNAVYAATYSTGASVSLGTITTLATTSQGQAPIGIALDVPANGYYVDTSTGVSDDTTANEVLFGSSLTSPEALTSVYSVPDQDGGTETLPTEAIVVEVQPVVAASGTVTFVRGGSAVTADSGATVSDSDGYDLASATVVISNNASGDTLTSTNEDGITGSFSSGTLTLTGVATAADYQAVLDTVTFSTTNSTDATARTLDWTVTDGVVSSATESSTVDVHLPPVVSAGATATFDGGGSPVVLDSGLTVSDSSSSTLVGASVTIVSATSTDRLNFSTQNGISGSYNTSNGVLTLTGGASVADYQAALESITYSVSPSDSDPTDGGGDTSRTIDWTVNDGVLSSNIATSTLDTVHEPPTISAGATATFDGGGSPVTLDSGVTASDGDSGGDLASAKVVIGGYVNGDTLAVGNAGGLSISFSNGTLTLSGSASIATYDTALQSVKYGFAAGGDPTDGGSDTSRTISWSVNDGVASSNTATSTLDVVHEPPTISAGGTATFDGGGSPVLLDSGAAASDPDSNGDLAGATVVISSGYTSGDTLVLGASFAGISTSFNDGTLTLTGSASIATYDAALDSVDYSFTPTDGDPTDGGSDTSRTIAWWVNDGVASSTAAGSTLDVVHVAPTVVAGASAIYPENAAPVALDPTLSVSDPDSGGNLAGATVAISSGFLAGDTLDFTTQNGITGSYDAGTGELTLSGVASIADYQAALQSVAYSFSGDPTDGGTDDSRTINWTVTDGVASSTPETSSLTALCFCKGTRIATPDGQVPVEHLAVGDRVLTAGGSVREICWIGVGRVLATRGRRNAATPVIVAKHAIAPNVPDRDLHITKGHGLFLDGVLIPAEFLVNHRSIRWDDQAQEVELYHIELETHDVLLANRAPAESYRDDGNRWLFQNANSGWHLPPKPPCAPVLTGGDLVDAIWRRLLDQAGARRLPPLTDDPDLHLVVDGRRIDAAERRRRAYVFHLPDCPGSVRIVSRDAVPAELGLARDPRPLGVALRRIVACQRNQGEAHFAFIEATDPRLVEGFHAFEPSEGPWCGPVTGYRWTDGNAVLPIASLTGFTGPFKLVLHLGGMTQYIAGPKARLAA